MPLNIQRIERRQVHLEREDRARVDDEEPEKSKSDLEGNDREGGHRREQDRQQTTSDGIKGGAENGLAQMGDSPGRRDVVGQSKALRQLPALLRAVLLGRGGGVNQEQIERHDPERAQDQEERMAEDGSNPHQVLLNVRVK